MTDYPLPSYAVGMWIVGDEIAIRIPPSAGHDSAHILRFPATEIGFRGVVSMLKAREAHKAFTKIGHPGQPTQHDIERLSAMARAIKVKPKTREEREIEAILAELEIEV